jgi:hypothetical protein
VTLRDFRKLDRIIRTWAEGHGYRILDKQFRLLRQGPFFWNSGHGQAVFRVLLEDREGGQRCGWVRVTRSLFRPMSIDAKWDD